MPWHTNTRRSGVDRATFQRLYRDTAPPLRAYLRLKCADAALADDLLQETYLRLLKRPLPELDAPRLKSYLYKTAHSALADHYRSRKREARWRESRWTDHGESMDAGSLGALDDGPGPGSLELPVDMQRVFETLRPRQQTLLWLAYVEGFTHDEIAELVSVNAGSVRVLLSRARAELAAKLDERGLAPTAARGERR